MDVLKQSGVYFLFGTDDEDRAIVYVGQAGSRKNGEGLLLRIREAHPSIEYWTEAVMFTTSNNSFGPTEISYLENRFYNMAVQVGRYVVKNGNDPNPGNITEETESELEEFIDYAKIVMGALGYKIFEPLGSPAYPPDALEDGEREEQILYFSWGTAKATGKRTSDGFVVFRGSTIRLTENPSCPQRAIKDRQVYADEIKDGMLREDLLFPSPSAAAAFVSGASVNGLLSWKNRDGIALKQLEEAGD